MDAWRAEHELSGETFPHVRWARYWGKTLMAGVLCCCHIKIIPSSPTYLKGREWPVAKQEAEPRLALPVLGARKENEVGLVSDYFY
jgi:hypothetical protein